MPAAPSTVTGADQDWPFQVTVWLPPVGAARHRVGDAEETEMVPGPVAAPAGDCGAPQEEPLKAKARPVASTAMQAVGEAQETATSAVPPVSGSGAPNRSVPGARVVVVVDEVVEVVLAASGAPGEPQAAPRSARAQAAGPRRAARPAGPARRVRGRPAPDAPPGAAGGRWVSRTRAPYSGRPWPRAQVRAPHALHSGTNPMAAPDSSVAGPEHRRGERPMGRLYAALFFLLVVFSAAMALITAGVYVSVWWLSVLGVGILVVFVALGGMLVPPARKAVAARDTKTAMAAMGAFGGLLALEFFIMATVCWVVGNRTLYLNNAYQALGLLIFLGLASVGVGGALGGVVMFTYVRHRTLVDAAEAAAA